MNTYLPSPPVAPPHLFISYRNVDEPFGTALVDHALTTRFGEERVFRASRSIVLGDDFERSILAAVRSAAALLAVIGPRWLRACDRAGRRRLDDPADWVRRELLTAFRHRVRVIPLLLDTELPAATDLPRELGWLARCQHLRMHHRHSRYEIARLTAEVATLVPELR